MEGDSGDEFIVVVMMTVVVMVIVGNSAGDDGRNDNTTFCGSIGVGYDFRMRHNDIPNSRFKGPQ